MYENPKKESHNETSLLHIYGSKGTKQHAASAERPTNLVTLVLPGFDAVLAIRDNWRCIKVALIALPRGDLTEIFWNPLKYIYLSMVAP